MTQQELAQCAKSYMDALANGIDPITRKELPEDTVLNRPQMIRCFFYVSDILRQVVENGGQVGGKRQGRKSPLPCQWSSGYAEALEILLEEC